MTEPTNDSLITLWDWPVRVTHWGFVLLVPAMWWSAEEGAMDLHQQLGMIFLGLLAFRILWGIIGSATARFGQFVKGPKAVIAYLRGGTGGHSHLGHNPIGGWSVVALLTLMTMQIGLGLIAQDGDGLFYGPLNHLVSYETADVARDLHEFLFDVLFVLILVHIAAIAFYLVVKKDNLIMPMISGRKRMGSLPSEQPRLGSTMALLAALTLALALVSWVWFGAPPFNP